MGNGIGKVQPAITAGVQGQVGIGEWSESFVGANLKVKF